MFWSLRESPLKSTHKAGVMSVSYGMGDLFDGEVTNGEKLRGFLKPAFRHQATQLNSGLLLEEPLEMRPTK